MIATAPPITTARRGDPEYERLAAEEAEFWRTQSGGFLERVERDAVDSPFERYTNRRFTDDERTPWYEMIPRYGAFKRGLALGTSGMAQDARILEANRGLQMTFSDISAGSLERWDETLGRRFPGRVHTQAADLNFAELPESSYDLIVSSSTLHHVVNLEHVATQINRALTPDGTFFMQDYCAESYFLFDERKKRIFEELFNRDIARQPGRKPGVVWINDRREGRSPFCAIRSSDILRTLGERLELRRLRTAATISGLLIFCMPADGSTIGRRELRLRRILDRARRLTPILRRFASPPILNREFVEELLVADEVICDADIFLPANAFAVYGKKAV